MKDIIEIQVLNEGKVFDTAVLYMFLKKLVTPFEDTKAYDLGLIDKNGKVLKSRATLKTQEEKNAFTVFDLLIWNLRKIIMKLPFGKTRLASFAAALYLIRESQQINQSLTEETDYLEDEDILYESFTDYFEEIENDTDTINAILAAIEELKIQEVIANSVGAGGISGFKPDDLRVNRKPPLVKRDRGARKKRR